MSQSVTDNRDFSIYVHSELDDYPLSPEAFRVYCHLVRRVGSNGMAWPSYKSIGEKCFRAAMPKASANTLRQKAIKAVKELIDARLINKKERLDDDGNNATNLYEINHRSQWKEAEGSSGTIPPSSPDIPPSIPDVPEGSSGTIPPSSPGIPKGIPVEVDSNNEGIPLTTSLAAPKAPTPQQEMFGAICEAIGWDYKTLSKEDAGQVAQAVGILTKADYHVEDIRLFMMNVWFKDWRWEKHAQHPTLKQLRQEIGKTRSIVAAAAPAKKKTARDMLMEIKRRNGANQ